ncbi:MAG: tyrosine--tRNA ligase [Ignavibacteria bacterium]|nr:tyrosine--tRNA ligase [Ignavibacteria bacterium]
MKSILNEQIDVLSAGTVEIIPQEELVSKIERSIIEKKPLNIKLGCDPSRPDLHIGHSVVLNKLREFQEFGHTAILIIGDYTGMIGDPSGKKKTRPQLTYKETRKNGISYFEQASKILDRNKTKIMYNGDWLGKLNLEDIIRIMSKFTVQRILERDDFTNRLKEQTEISLHEILYPIMQGWDSVVINADVELGGTDQKFNNLIGREMQKRFGLEPQVVVLMPLLEGVDGQEKMSKSLNNAICFNDTPQDIFGKTMSIPDSLIYKYFKLTTKIPTDELLNIKIDLEKGAVNPRDLKRKLAFELVNIYYDENTARQAMSEFEKIFVRKEIPDEIEEFKLTEKNIKLVELMVTANLSDSKSNARRLIEQGAVDIDGERITDVNYTVNKNTDFIIKVGKRKFIKILI